jgi:cobalt transporter subunit CbtA
MKLFQRIFFAALFAGLLAGAAMTVLQQWRVAPLILEAEVYEQQEAAAPASAAHEHTHDAATPAHEHDADAWAPQDGVERIAYTVGADLLAALGFALLLSAASVLTGLEVTARNGVLWGLAGFAIFQLAPAFGLPPELPGMPAADLVARQVWWIGCAAATATAIFGITKFRNWPAVAIGIVLILLPHAIGAPPQPDEASSVPAHLATSFAASALGVGAAFWLLLGPLYGYLMERFARGSVAAEQRVAV